MDLKNWASTIASCGQRLAREGMSYVNQRIEKQQQSFSFSSLEHERCCGEWMMQEEQQLCRKADKKASLSSVSPLSGGVASSCLVFYTVQNELPPPPFAATVPASSPPLTKQKPQKQPPVFSSTTAERADVTRCCQLSFNDARATAVARASPTTPAVAAVLEWNAFSLPAGVPVHCVTPDLFAALFPVHGLFIFRFKVRSKAAEAGHAWLHVNDPQTLAASSSSSTTVYLPCYNGQLVCKALQLPPEAAVAAALRKQQLDAVAAALCTCGSPPQPHQAPYCAVVDRGSKCLETSAEEGGPAAAGAATAATTIKRRLLAAADALQAAAAEPLRRIAHQRAGGRLFGVEAARTPGDISSQTICSSPPLSRRQEEIEVVGTTEGEEHIEESRSLSPSFFSSKAFLSAEARPRSANAAAGVAANSRVSPHSASVVAPGVTAAEKCCWSGDMLGEGPSSVAFFEAHAKSNNENGCAGRAANVVAAAHADSDLFFAKDEKVVFLGNAEERAKQLHSHQLSGSGRRTDSLRDFTVNFVDDEPDLLQRQQTPALVELPLKKRQDFIASRHARTEQRVREKLQETQERRQQELEKAQDRLMISESLQQQLEKWAKTPDGKYKDIRTLICTVHEVLWVGAEWEPVAISTLMISQKVKKYYRKALLLTHPDKHQACSTEQLFRAEKIFQAFNEAFKIHPL